jgi:hypothetical protein
MPDLFVILTFVLFALTCQGLLSLCQKLLETK